MKPAGKPFTIRYNNRIVEVDIYRDKEVELYHIKFGNQDPLFVTKSVEKGEAFWTSVPEGQLKLAGEIGTLIDNRDNKPKQIALF